MSRFINTLILAATLTAPLAMNAQDHPNRYYDKTHKDYHEWNDNENQRYHEYQTERRVKTTHEFNRAKKSEQQDYWKWRHEHGDNK
jgi:Ni/Co efflux regulator RcnB